MLLPANTGSGESLFVTAMSATVITEVVAVPVLFPGVGSVVAVAAVALLVMVVPLAVFGLMLTTIVNVAASSASDVALEKTTLPVPPTAGAVVDHPAPTVTLAETNVEFAGTASVTVTVCASLGPLF